MPLRRFAPRLTLVGLLSTTTLIAVALALFAAFDRFAILLMVAILASVAFLGFAYPRRFFTKCYLITCGMIASATIFYLVSVVPATWLIARCHTLDSGGRPELAEAYECVGGPAVECWVDAPMPIRSVFMRSVSVGMPSNASFVEYPFGFGYTTMSSSGGSANVILASFYRGG